MKQLLRAVVVAGLVAGSAADVSAQQRQPGSRPVSERAEFRTPLPRSVIHDEMKGELYAVRMLNHNVGWALGGHSSSHTILFRTVDGGKSWERQTLFDGQGTRLRDIGFADANNGWIVGDQHILRTTDGGDTWIPVDTDKALGGYSVDASDLLVLGPDAIVVGTNGQNRQIMRTVDGGGTWELIGLVKDGGGGAGSENSVTGLALSGESTIFATTGSHPYSPGVIYRSDDGGRSWERVAEAEKPLHGIAFRGKRGVAVGENTAFYTADGGDTWTRTPMPGRRYAVGFIDENTVLAVGRDPSVVASGNGGRTWQAARGPIVESGALVAIAGVDPGWVFMASDHALHHFVDPSHTEPIASGTIVLPVDVQIPGMRALPRGFYDVMFGHRGDNHVVKLDKRGDVPATSPGQGGAQARATGVGQRSTGSGSQSTVSGQAATTSDTQIGEDGEAQLAAAVAQQKSRKPPACAAPCGVTVPVRASYQKEGIGAGQGMGSFLKFSLEPTASGVAVVVRAAVTPPRNVALALAAVGAPQSSEREAVQTATKTVEKVGGLLGRLQKAAAGDLRGAARGSGINPQAAKQRLRAAKAAPPAIYKVTVRHELDLFGEKKN